MERELRACRRPGSSKKDHTAALLLLTGVHSALGAGCVSHREGWATRPLVAKSASNAVSLKRAAVYGDQLWIVVDVGATPAQRVLGARLSASGDGCRAGTATRRVFDSAGEWVLVFDVDAVNPLLDAGARLGVDFGEPKRCVSLDLGGREVLFAASNIGIGGGIRYRDPGFFNAHYAHSLTGELGLDLWVHATRLRASYEIGLARCHGTRPEQLLGCTSDDALVPVIFGAYATHYFEPQGRYTPALGLGYQGQLIYGRDIATEPGKPRPDPVLHGPRVSLLVVGTPPSVPLFEGGPPRTSSGFELSLDLVGRNGFSEPSLVLGVGWTTTAAF